MKLRLEVDGHVFDIEVQRTGNRVRATCDGEALEAAISGTGATVRLEVQGRSHVVELADDARGMVDGSPFEYRVEDFAPGEPVGAGVADGRVPVRAAMSGRLVKVLVRPGQDVVRGQALFILESMKMQNELQSPAVGRVGDVVVVEGEVVEPGRILAHLESARPA